jgi:hypothetical protein
VSDGLHPQIVIACEHDSDARVAKGFATRILTREIPYLEDVPEALPTWVGVLPNSGYLRWASIAELYKNAGLPATFGVKMNGQPPKLDAVTTLKALRLAERLNPVATVLMRDIDAQAERAQGLEQGRNEYQRTSVNSAKMKVVLAAPNRYREAWLLAGFDPKNERERQRLETERNDLKSFDPTTQPHRLRDAPGQPRCAKDVWNRLSDEDAAREIHCWEQTPLETLHARGADCGLSAFLKEIETHLVPALK